jgi:hypothetical protein
MSAPVRPNQEQWPMNEQAGCHANWSHQVVLSQLFRRSITETYYGESPAGLTFGFKVIVHPLKTTRISRERR